MSDDKNSCDKTKRDKNSCQDPGMTADAIAIQLRENLAVSDPKTDGPRAPDSPGAPPPQRVNRLVPFVHADDVDRSISFYSHLGFTVASVYSYRGRLVWASLASDGAELMVSTDGDAIDPEKQGVLFYLYSDNLTALRQQLVAARIEAGEIVDGTPGPKQELRLVDPDGYVLMIAQTE